MPSPILALLITVTASTSTLAQQDTASLHATIRTWADETWLLALDRSAARGGRLNSRGTLQRFHAEIDAEYELDRISAGFGITEEYRWERIANGARYWAGSINYEHLITGADLKASVPIGRGWTSSIRITHQDLPPLFRNRIGVRFRKDWRGPFVYVEGSLLAYKPENDVSIGGGWASPTRRLVVSLSVVDAFSDIVYQVLGVWPGFADTALDYERQPLALRTSVEQSVGRRLRIEADAGFFTPSRVRAYRQLSPSEGFRQEETFAQAAGLIEWSAAPTLRAGAMARYVRATTRRTPLPLDTALNDFRLTEQTTSAGAFLLAIPAPRWRLEAWGARVARPERREYAAAGLADTDYRDATWTGQALVGYRAPGGFKLNGSLEWDLRNVTRGDGQVPVQESLARHNTRVKLDVGWTVRDRFDVLLGYRVDLDGDLYTDHGRFDGAHGRFVMSW